MPNNVAPFSSATRPRRSAELLAGVSLIAIAALAPRVAEAADVPTSYIGANGNWSDPTQWNNGAPNGGSATTVDNGGTVHTDGSNFTDTLTVGPATGSAVSISNNTFLQIGTSVFNQGAITINAASGFGSELRVAAGANVQLSGGGTITLSNNGNNVIRDADAGTGSLNNVDNTIQGAGLFGNGQLGITNGTKGLIDGNQSNALVVNSNGLGITNQGTIRASGGGSLVIQNSGVKNTGGTLLSTGTGSTLTVSNATVNGGVLTTSAGGTMGTGGNSTLNNVTISSGSTYTGTNNTATYLGGTITNDGTITSNATSSFGAELRIAAGTTTTLTGGGTVTLSNDGANLIRDADAGTGTLINANNTIQGAGQLGNGQLGIVNQAAGLIDGNQSTPLVVQSNGAGIANSGTIRASAGGNLTINGSTLTQAAGGVLLSTGANAAKTGSNVLVQNSTINGGILSTANGGTMGTSGNSTLNNVTIGSGSTYSGNNNTTTYLGGTITNDGTITSNATSSFGSELRIAAGTTTTLTGGGTITLSNNGGNLIRDADAGTGTLINVNNTIQGAGQLGNGQLVIVNQGAGLIDGNQSTALVLQSNGAGIGNSGTIRASAGGNLTINGSTLTQAAGGVLLSTGAAKAGSNVLVQNSTINGGTLTTANGGTMGTSGNSTLNNVTLSKGSTYDGNTNTVTYLGGTITNNGTITSNAASGFGSELRIAAGTTTTLTGGGTITLSNNGGNLFRDADAGTGTLINVNNTIQGAGQLGNGQLGIVNQTAGLIDANQSTALVLQSNGKGISNDGTIRASAGGNLTINGSGLNQTAAGVLLSTGAGSSALVQNSTVTGGTLTTAAGGTMGTSGNSTLNNVTISNGSTYSGNTNTTTYLGGTITNNGTITSNAASGLGSELRIAAGATTTLAGGGTITLSDNAGNYIRDADAGTGILVNTNNTIQGAGQVGNGQLGINNGGLILADGTNALNVATNGVGLTNSGTLQAGTGSTLNVTGGALANYAGTTTTLTGGTYRADAGGTLNLNTGAITTDAATIVLNGPGSAINTGAGAIETQINAVAAGGQLQVLGNRNYATANGIANDGLVQLGGGALAPAALTNSTTGTLKGFGTYAPTSGGALSNAGLVQANGGKLTLANGVAGAGTLQIDAGASLDISGAATSNRTGTLTHNGVNLALGSQNILVSTDYTNAAFGTGNGFNNHANVTGTGKILANGDTKLVIGGTGVTNGGSSTPTLALGNFHVGGSTSGSFTIGNGGTTGPVLRGAVQTTGLTNPAIGLTAANFGPLANGATTTESLTFSSAAGGALTGQSFKVVTNFDNVAPATVSVTGTGYRLAAANAIAPLAFGNVHQGDTVQGALTLTNTAAADGFSEALDASFGTVSDPRIHASGSVSLLAAGATNSTGLKIAVDTSATGSLNGTAHVNLASDGSGTSGLGITALPGQDVGVSASISTSGSVYGLAQASVHTPEPVAFGNVRIGSAQSQALTVSNIAPNDGFHEKLDAQIGGAAGAATAAGRFALLAPGSTDSASLSVGLNTAAAGARTGTATIALQSDGKGTSGLGLTNLASQTVNVSGNVYRLASPSTIAPVTIAARVGDAAPSVGVSLTNVSPDIYTEGLKASLGGATGPFTSSGTISNLAAGATDAASLKVGLATGTSGTFTGAATASLTSTGAGTDGATDLALAPQTVALTGKVYATAVASVTPSVSFGIVHVGDTVASKGVVVSNTATGALTDVLRGGFGTLATGFTGSGSLGDVAAGGSGTLSVALNTAKAGVYAGNATLALTSHDASLVDVAASGGPVALSGQVNNYANGAIVQLGGSGTLSGAATTYTLNFGTLALNSGSATADLAVTNAVTGPADVLGGSFSGSAPDFALTGLDAFAGMAAGGLHDLGVSLATSALGAFDEFVTLAETGSNASGYSAALPDIRLELRGDVTTVVATVAEPGTLAVFGSALAGLGALLRRRRR